jgi:hypothetical protein
MVPDHGPVVSRCWLSSKFPMFDACFQMGRLLPKSRARSTVIAVLNVARIGVGL